MAISCRVKNVIYIFIFFIFLGCSEKLKEEEIPVIGFEGQIKLSIDNKYFDIKVDSMRNSIYPVPYRIDIMSNQLYRYWVREYNEMVEIRFYNREAFEKDSGKDIFERKGYNYLIGVKNNKAFYIKWRNDYKFSNNISSKPRITSDIGEYTVEIESNLPQRIIMDNYSNIKCAITKNHRDRIKIKDVNIGKIISSNYYPFSL